MADLMAKNRFMEEQTVKVQVKTPARLHLGLIDMNGDLGRMFGGLGVGIDHPNVIVEAENAENFSVTGQETELATILAKRFFTAYKIQAKVHINVVAGNSVPYRVRFRHPVLLSHGSSACKTV